MSHLLEDILQRVERRYRLPVLPMPRAYLLATDPAARLAAVIEEARQSLATHKPPGVVLQRLFVDALAQLIREALHSDTGDPAIQALVLRQSVAAVGEYASLSAGALQDEREVRGIINAIAHPAKLERMPACDMKQQLGQLHASGESGTWLAVSQAAEASLAHPDTADPVVAGTLTKLLDSPALQRLQRLEVLRANSQVQLYEKLREQHGPRAKSSQAIKAGVAARQRGAEVETLTKQALEALAERLNKAEEAPADGPAAYCVVTSMRVPASFPNTLRHAKTEWDAVLLRRARRTSGVTEADDIGVATPLWDVCLLAEAKASVEAASMDLPRLVRGLRLLAGADANASYRFQAREGAVLLRGASLRTLDGNEARLRKTVLYCCDAPAANAPRPLNAASRMLLLSAPVSREYAAALAGPQPSHADPSMLNALWQEVLELPRWQSVIQQYPAQQLARDLMVNTQDLLAAVNGCA